MTEALDAGLAAGRRVDDDRRGVLARAARLGFRPRTGRAPLLVCGTCGAAVDPQSAETHQRWHTEVSR